jgi:hypothetical protein
MPLNWNFPAKIGPKTGRQVTHLIGLRPSIEDQTEAVRPGVVWRCKPLSSVLFQKFLVDHLGL